MDSVEKVVEFPHEITSPFIHHKRLFVCVPSESTVCRILENGTCQEVVSTDGVPVGAAYDDSGVLFVCDHAHQAVLTVSVDKEVSEFVREYEGKAFKGPSAVVFDGQGNLYFTDSGPLGDTSIDRPYGSVYSVTSDGQLLQPLAVESLAYPAGLAVSPDDQSVYVAETMNNRILRFVQHPRGTYHMSVFRQFSGLLGPRYVATDASGFIYVGRFDLPNGGSSAGIVSVLCPQTGAVVKEYSVPGCELTGLCVDRENNVLYITEATTQTLYRCPLMPENTAADVTTESMH